MSAVVFLDTETTGLSMADDIWEIAAIRRAEDGTETELHLFVEHSRAKCDSLPLSFREDHYNRYLDHKAVSRKEACQRVADLFRNGKPHVVGAVPNFDTERLTHMAELEWPRWSDPKFGWHYHLIDVENLAVGWIAANLDKIPNESGSTLLALPWDSDVISAAVGVDPQRFPRHTAMGDVRWAMAIYDAVISTPASPVVTEDGAA